MRNGKSNLLSFSRWCLATLLSIFLGNSHVQELNAFSNFERSYLCPRREPALSSEARSGQQPLRREKQKTNGHYSSYIRRSASSLLLTSSSNELTTASSTSDSKKNEDEEFDVIVIGSGIGGLSCAALCAKCYNFQTICLEAHDTSPGGVAHSFERYSPAGKFVFDSGPSLLSGMSEAGSTNPLRQVLEAIDKTDAVTWKTYNGWIMHDLSDNKSFKVTTGNGIEFENAIASKTGSMETKEEFIQFRNKCLEPNGISDSSSYIPPMVLRNDGFVNSIQTIYKYLFAIMIGIGPVKGNLLTGPFSAIMDQYGLNNKFIRYWFDYLSFALSGLDASQTQAAAVAYMMKDLHKPNAVLDYPMGGMGSLIEALIKGLEDNRKGEIRLNNRVEKFLLSINPKSGKPMCTGVVLANGKVIHARRGVVCNAPIWNMARILQDSCATSDGNNESITDPLIMQTVYDIQKQANDICMTRSFMHLHLGIPKDGLPDNLECHHSVLNMDIDVTAEQNMVIISIPTVFDPTLAPEGFHVIHAYTAACDNFDDWESFVDGGKESGKVGQKPNSIKASSYAKSEQYQKLKDERSEVLWKAIETVIPDVRQRAKQKGSIVLAGTPLTHRRYNQRYKGTYGPAPSPDQSVWELPSAITSIENLLACGDTTFPGIGLPGVAASGTIAANTLASVQDQNKLINKLKKKGALQ